MKADSKSEFDNLIGFSGEDELAGIDALLNNASDDATARVDFVSIKRRAIKQAKRKKQKRFFSYVAAAACMLLCFGMVGAALSNRGHNGDISVKRPTHEPDIDDTPVPGTTPSVTFGDGNVPNEYTTLMSIGVPTKGGSSGELKPDELFPDELPNYMVRRVDDRNDEGKKYSIAEGKDDKGLIKYFDCSIVEKAPYDLDIGQVGTFEDDTKCIFYWQVSEDYCLRVRFFGFKKEEAGRLFTDMTNDILASRSTGK